VKPQFEAPREDVGEGGIVRDPAVREAALAKVAAAFEEAGLRVQGSCESPITGHKGNVEYLLLGTMPLDA
jgi:23S rRNA (cytidine1920-2'-O)/16S rRNA (cytidine1409-2'-O)-methyltransferase